MSGITITTATDETQKIEQRVDINRRGYSNLLEKKEYKEIAWRVNGEYRTLRGNIEKCNLKKSRNAYSVNSMIDKDFIADFIQSSGFDSSDESEDFEEFIAVQQRIRLLESGRKRTIYSLKQHMVDGIVGRWETDATQTAKVAGHQETSSENADAVCNDANSLHAKHFADVDQLVDDIVKNVPELLVDSDSESEKLQSSTKPNEKLRTTSDKDKMVEKLFISDKEQLKQIEKAFEDWGIAKDMKTELAETIMKLSGEVYRREGESEYKAIHHCWFEGDSSLANTTPWKDQQGNGMRARLKRAIVANAWNCRACGTAWDIQIREWLVSTSRSPFGNHSQGQLHNTQECNCKTEIVVPNVPLPISGVPLVMDLEVPAVVVPIARITTWKRVSATCTLIQECLIGDEESDEDRLTCEELGIAEDGQKTVKKLKRYLPNPLKRDKSRDKAKDKSPLPHEPPTPPLSARVSLSPSVYTRIIDGDNACDAGPSASVAPQIFPAIVIQAPVEDVPAADDLSGFQNENAHVNSATGSSPIPATAGTFEQFINKSQLQTLSERTRDVILHLRADWNPADAEKFLEEFEERGKSVTEFKENIDSFLSKASNINSTASNTVKDAFDTIVGGLDSIADTHPILKMAWFLVKTGYNIARAGVKQAEEFDKLSTRFVEGSAEIHRLMCLKTSGVPLNTSQLFSKTIDAYISCLIDVADGYLDYFKARPSGVSSLFGGTSQKLADLNERLDATNADLRRVKDDGTLEIVIATAERVVATAERLEVLIDATRDIGARLGTPTSNDQWDFETLRKHCKFTDLHSIGEIDALSSKKHKGTRDWIIADMTESLKENDFIWLCGKAGTGKSVIAGCVAKSFKEKGLLAASFFCQHDNMLRDTVAALIQTVSYELASKNQDFHRKLIKSLEDAKYKEFTVFSVFDLIRIFLVNPFDGFVCDDLVIVIDALDELQDYEDIYEVFRFFKSRSVKLFLTSRPDHMLTAKVKKFFKVKHFEVGSEDNFSDILLFAHDRLDELVQDLPSDGQVSLGPNEIKEMAEKLTQASHGLFIWITLVLGNVSGVDKYIVTDQDPKDVLEEAMYGSPSRETTNEIMCRLKQLASMDLQSLYCRALCKAYKSDSDDSAFKVAISVIQYAKIPLTVHSVASLVDHFPKSSRLPLIQVRRACNSLESLLRGQGSRLSFIHKTFSEYLFNIGCHSNCGITLKTCTEGASRHCCHNQAAGRFQIDPTVSSLNMAHACLAILNSSQLHEKQPAQSLFRNMGKLDGLEKNPKWLVKDTLSETLQYAVTFWSHHFAVAFPTASTTEKDALIQALFQFSKTKLPYYLEGLLLLEKLNNVFEVVGTVTTALFQVKSTESEYIKSIFRDLKLVAYNFRQNLLFNPLQVYEKPIVMVPLETEYYKAYHTLGPVTMTVGHDLQWGELTLVGHDKGVNSTVVSHDGQTVVSGSYDNTVKLWSAQTGECIKTLVGHSHSINSVAISLDGQTVVSGSYDNTVKVWSVQTGECIKSFGGHSNSVSSVAISSDGQTVVSGSWDNTVRLWVGECGKILVGHTHWVNSVAISLDGQTVVSGSHDNTVKLWSVQNGECIKTFVGHSDEVTSVAISSDGHTVVSGSSSVKLWSVHSGECVATLVGHSRLVNSVAISYDGQIVASGSDDETAKLWSVQSGECMGTFRGHSNGVTSVAISLDGQTLVSGSDDMSVKIWSVQTKEYNKALVGHSNGVKSLAISSDGQTVVSASHDMTVKLWSVPTGECIKTFGGHSNGVASVAISSDGQTIVSGSHDMTVKLWSVETGYCIKTLVGHSHWVNSVAISLDGQTVLSGSFDETVKLWSVQTGDCIMTLDGDFHSSLIKLSTQFGFKTDFLKQRNDVVDQFQKFVVNDNGEDWISRNDGLCGCKGSIVYICLKISTLE
ncbi:hypothetical protein BDR26DRAFT_1008460 [Obelidium mucronatum]|nr:hypothetical protein BDR26DRAFT_1008460 [Obelidium mucronatum]